MQRICGNHPKKPRWRCSRTVSTETCFISQSKKSGRVETSRRVEPWPLTTLQRSLWQIDETRRVLFKQTRWGSPVVWAVDNSEIVREGTINNSEHATNCSDDGSQNASISHISITMLVEQTSISSRSEKTIPLFPNACSKFRRPIHVVYRTCTWK